MKRISFASILIIALFVPVLFSGNALAIGPVDLNVYAGPSASLLGGGYDIGASGVISLPLLPNVGLQAEMTNANMASGINSTITRIGILVKYSAIPLMPSITLAGGISTLAANGTYTIGGKTISASSGLSGNYLSLGAELKLLSIVVNPKFVYNVYGSDSISEGIVNVGWAF